jgi:HrpA-like RNA helicase
MAYKLQILGGSSEDLLPTLLKTNVVTSGDPNDSLSTLRQYRGVDYIIKYIQDHTDDVKSPGGKVFSIQSGTGSGKSTVIPPELYRKLDAKRIIVTEPKRINAINIPQEIIQFNSEFELGLNIGYSTGVIKRLPEEPGIIFMTTGSLYQRLINMKDPESFCYKYDYILIDEVHLHDVEIDFLLMEIKNLLDHNWKNPKCPNIILMSATLKIQKYQEYFGSPHFIEVSGQSFPITEIWPEVPPENSDAYIVDMIEKHNKDVGDILIFMPTAASMKKLKEYLDGAIKKYEIVLLSGANISSAEIVPVFDRTRDAKVTPYIIISTNVAETGITFPQLKIVFDMGKQLHVMFNPTFDATVIYTGAITKFSAQQRRGRVGRNSEGQWFPVYTKKVYDGMVDENFPAIYTSDITQVMLSYLCRINDIMEVETILKHMELVETGSKVISTTNKLDLNVLDLIHYPAVDTIKYTFEKLYVLGLVDELFYPTVTGYIAQKLNKIPIEATKMVISGFYHASDSSHNSVINYIITIAAILSQQKSGIIDSGEWLASPMAKDVVWFNTNIVYDDFIIQLLAFEYFEAEFKTIKKKEDWSLLDIDAWCVEHHYNFNALLEVIEQRDDIMVNLLQNGFKIPPNYFPLRELVEDKSSSLLDIVRIIQQCEVEGFRFKLYKWNSNAKKYQLSYSPSKLSVDPPPGISVDFKDHNWAKNPKIPKNIIQLNVVYIALKGRMSFTNGKTMFSVLLTDIIELDDLFIP